MSRFRSRRAVWMGVLALACILRIDAAPSAAEPGAAAPAGGTPAPAAQGAQSAVFAGGCFWGVEAVFRHVKGVASAVSGYAGGTTKSPSYEEVSSGNTGHAESVRVTYDPKQVSYAQLLKIFFAVAHNPTELNRQGPDVGTQYRSAVFYENDEQQREAQAYIAKLGESKAFSRPIVTQLAPLASFYPAETYHQNYLATHPYQPYIVINDLPKIDHLRKEFPDWYR
jgi:peptide-methionine (S)-S-oxide reductase